MYDYENTRRVVYAGGATFVPVCERCHRFVKADPMVLVCEESTLANATCSKCGRTRMVFEGFLDYGTD
jgi:hypothetical protein